jgi:hypothetical protein
MTACFKADVMWYQNTCLSTSYKQVEIKVCTETVLATMHTQLNVYFNVCCFLARWSATVTVKWNFIEANSWGPELVLHRSPHSGNCHKCHHMIHSQVILKPYSWGHRFKNLNLICTMQICQNWCNISSALYHVAVEDMQLDVLETGIQVGHVLDSLLYYFGSTVTWQTTVPVEAVDFILHEKHTVLCKVTNN